jgi:hypothetical protein
MHACMREACARKHTVWFRVFTTGQPMILSGRMQCTVWLAVNKSGRSHPSSATSPHALAAMKAAASFEMLNLASCNATQWVAHNGTDIVRELITCKLGANCSLIQWLKQ